MRYAIIFASFALSILAAPVPTPGGLDTLNSRSADAELLQRHTTSSGENGSLDIEVRSEEEKRWRGNGGYRRDAEANAIPEPSNRFPREASNRFPREADPEASNRFPREADPEASNRFPREADPEASNRFPREADPQRWNGRSAEADPQRWNGRSAEADPEPLNRCSTVTCD